jgi:hypothetical protein
VLEFAPLALDSEEAISQDPTSQELIKLFDHKVWQWVAGVLLHLFPKRQPVLLHNFVENRLFGLVALIGVLGCAGNFGHAYLQGRAIGWRAALEHLLKQGGSFCPEVLFAPDVDAYDVSYWQSHRSTTCCIWN